MKQSLTGSLGGIHWRQVEKQWALGGNRTSRYDDAPITAPRNGGSIELQYDYVFLVDPSHLGAAPALRN